MKTAKRRAAEATLGKVQIENNVLDNVYSLEYFGSRLQCDGDDKADVRHRMDIAQATFASVSHLWMDHRLSRNMKLKAPLHGTIRPHGACRLHCTWANRSVWHVARMSRTRENRVNRNYSSFYFRADSAARAVQLPNQSAADTYNDLHLIRLRTRDGQDVTMHLNASILLRNMFLSVNMEFFCRINNRPRNGLPVMLDCSQYGTSRFKKISPMP